MRKTFVIAVVIIIGVLVVITRTKEAKQPPDPLPVSDYTTTNLMDVGAAAHVAQQFVGLWAKPQPGDTVEEWEDRLDAYVTAEVGRGLLATDLDNLPGEGLSTVDVPDIRAVSTYSVSVVVTLADGSQIAVEVVPNGPGYGVKDFTGVGE